ncbi:MAG TPA: hypothetical protein EYQ63_12075 [Fuerstia sp.]|nr:hypothetical protein [Fuerstiella sp.]
MKPIGNNPSDSPVPTLQPDSHDVSTSRPALLKRTVKTVASARIEDIVAKISLWLLAAESRQVFQDSQHVAALVDLTGRILECEGADAAHRRVVDELKTYLCASSVTLGICRDGTTVCRLVVSSDVADVDRFSDATRIAEAALQESVARSDASIWPTSDSSNRHALLAHRQFADDVGADSVVGCPLRTADGTNVGALVVTFRADSTTNDVVASTAVPSEDRLAQAATALKFLRAGEQSIANALHLQNRSCNSLTDMIRNGVRRTFT